MATWDDVTTLGIWLGFELECATKLRSENNSVQGAALNILGSFYQSVRSEAEKWQMIIRVFP